MEKLNIFLTLRCTPRDHFEIKLISDTLNVSQSDVTRAALREGLKIVGDRGIQPAHTEKIRQ